MAKKKKESKSKSKKNKQIADIKTNIINTIILVLIIVAIIYVAYTTIKLIIKPTDIVQIEEGTISSEESVIGYVIREETIIKGKEADNNMIHIKMEGEKVSKGDIVFRYHSNNEENINSKIEELNSKIQEALIKEEAPSSDIKAINMQIENKIEELSSRNNIEEIAEYKKDINNYVAKKAKIAGELSSDGAYIKELMEEKANYQNEIYAESEYVTAPTSGIVSYRIDNLEEVLTVENFREITKKSLSELNLKTGQIITSSNSMGKVVNNFECYIATSVKSDEAKAAEIGDKVKIRLANQDEVIGTIENIKEEDDGSLLIVFKVTKSVEQLIDYRKISIDIIWWEYNGLKVPNNSIIYDNGLSYVVRNRAGYLDKILVKILETNQNYSIVGNYSTEELKKIGFEIADIDSYKKISMHDEILVSPDIEKIK